MSTSVGTEVSSTSTANKALGANRFISAELISGNSVQAGVQSGLYIHEQGPIDKGISRIRYSFPRLDLKADGASAFVLDIQSFDYPFNQSLELTIKVVDADFSSKYSMGTLTLNSQVKNVSKTLLFSSMTVAGPSGEANFGNVGEIEVAVYGIDVAHDLVLSKFRTNGKCSHVPFDSGKDKTLFDDVIDECEVCNGDGSSCADCFGIPNGDSLVDVCGVCEGNGKSCLDCNGEPNGPIKPGAACATGKLGLCSVGEISKNCTCEYEDMVVNVSSAYEAYSEKAKVQAHDFNKGEKAYNKILFKKTGKGTSGVTSGYIALELKRAQKRYAKSLEVTEGFTQITSSCGKIKSCTEADKDSIELLRKQTKRQYRKVRKFLDETVKTVSSSKYNKLRQKALSHRDEALISLDEIAGTLNCLS